MAGARMKIWLVTEYDASPTGQGEAGIVDSTSFTLFRDEEEAVTFASTAAQTQLDNCDRGRNEPYVHGGDYLWEVWDAQFPDNDKTEYEDEYLVAQIWVTEKEV